MPRIIKYIYSFIIILIVAAMAIPAVCDSLELGENETKMGAEAAAEIAKENKLSTNEADLKRVRDMGNKIADIANKKETPSVYGTSKITPFKYTFNIIEEKDVNAFCVPGGFIYVYRGLLDFVESDAELASVIAHEITHASHHHMVYLLKKQASMQNVTAVALLAAMIGGSKSSDLSNLVLGVQLYQIAKVNGYGMQAERDADAGAILYMRESGYNPVGLLTFLERLARRPEYVDYGIYRNHPIDAERVACAKSGIVKLGLPINRRATTFAIVAEARPVKDVAGDFEVLIDDQVIYRAMPLEGKSSEQRARDATANVNSALDSDLKMYEIKSDASSIIGKGKMLISFTEEEAKLLGKTPSQAATDAATAIRNVIWKQMANTLH